MTPKIVNLLTELCHRLENLYGSHLVHLILYGSQARGDAGPGSDIDILVVLEGPIKSGEEIARTGEIIAALSLKYDEVISCVFVSTEQFEHEQNPLLINIRREGISYWPPTNQLQQIETLIQEERESYAASSEVDQESDLEQLDPISPVKPPANPSQLALLHKASESLAAAKLLAGQEFYNFAISRAYYTMFYIASAFLLSEGFTFSKHSTVIALFGQHFAKTGRVPVEYHRYLIEAENSRKIGDYSIGSELDETEATTQITRAEQFLELAAEFLALKEK